MGILNDFDLATWIDCPTTNDDSDLLDVDGGLGDRIPDIIDTT